jgi:GlpG protein
MRLIGDFQDERQIFGFQLFLKKEGIQSVYDASKDAQGQPLYRLWIIEEDDFDKAYAFYQQYQRNPQDFRFEQAKEKIPEPAAPQDKGPSSKWKVRMAAPRQGSSFSLNNFIILLCGLLFILNSIQERNILTQKGLEALQVGFTPLEKKLVFDYPQYFVNFEKFLEEYPIRTPEEIKKLSAEGQACFEKVKNAPTWKGVLDLLVKRSSKDYEQLPPGTLFGKIRQGEYWRLFTPALLHFNFIHILFNMAWVWLLGRQIELRLGMLRYLIFSLIVGIAANVAQYLMSGPEFLGYSGIVVGMVGFIWMRQKIAPWEGYPLQPVIVRFMAIYVVVLLALELVSIGLDYFRVTELYAPIANTAHIVGGITGILLARFPFFSRSKK